MSDVTDGSATRVAGTFRQQRNRSRGRSLVTQYGLMGALFVLVRGRPKPKPLRPSGHSAFIERLRTPFIVATSASMTVGATYVLAKTTFIAFITAVFMTHDLATAIQDGVALVPVIVTGAIIDYTFVTAAIRFGMHRQRGRPDRVYVVAAVFALLFTGLTETLTLAYLFYEVEPSSVIGFAVSVVQAVPNYLFWVRSGAAMICLFYLVTFVLAVRFTRRDLKHAQGAKSGSIAMAYIEDLLQADDTEDLDAKLAGMGAALALFRDADATTAEDESEHELRDEKLQAAMQRFVNVRLGRSGGYIVEADPPAPSPVPQLGRPSPISTYLNNRKDAHEGRSQGYSDDSDPAVPAIVNGTNGNGGTRNGTGRYDSRAEAQRSQIHSLSQTAALSSTSGGSNDPRASLVLVPPASSAATAEWLSFEDDAPTPELYAPLSQPLTRAPQPNGPSHTAAKRQQAARDRKAAGKQRKAWAQDAAAKGDPTTHPASSGSRKRRSDADRPRAISDDVLERQIQTMVDLLIARESPDTHEVLHDYYTVAMRPMKRAAVKAIKRLYGTDETVNEMAVYRARDRWHTLMQDGKAPTGTVMDLEDLDGFEIPDETDLGADEGYGTLGMVTDDFEYTPE